MLKGFKDFIMRGNLVEIAVAFIIGGAFATVVTSFTAVVLSLIAKATGGKNPDMTSYRPGGIPLGVFLTATIAFLILAFVVYFFVVTPYNALQARMAQGPGGGASFRRRRPCSPRSGTCSPTGRARPTSRGGGGLS